jgi:hypothetical protein
MEVLRRRKMRYMEARQIRYDQNKATALKLCQQSRQAPEAVEKALGVSRETAYRYLRELEMQGYLKREQSRGSRQLHFSAIRSGPYTHGVSRVSVERKPGLPFNKHLSRLMGYTNFKPPKGMRVMESHASWIGKSYSGHIGSGSCAMLETA